MQLPNTQNANHLYAFKKGYRLASEGKLMSHMPATIKQQPELRTYFQMGWQQFQDEYSCEESSDPTPWRSRFAWGFMAILAGIGTASLIISDMQAKQQAQTEALATFPAAPVQVAPQTPATTESLSNPTPQAILSNTEPAQANEPSHTLRNVPNPTKAATKQSAVSTPNNATAEAQTQLGLLSHAARNDLTLNQQALAEQTNDSSTQTPLEALSTTPISFNVAVLTDAIKDKQTGTRYPGLVPKNVKTLYFFTQIKDADNQTLYHRWRYNNQIMATIPLKIKSNLYRTWSSKRMASAWTGQWHVEVLNSQHQVIYRHSFKYGNQ